MPLQIDILVLYKSSSDLPHRGTLPEQVVPGHHPSFKARLSPEKGGKSGDIAQFGIGIRLFTFPDAAEKVINTFLGEIDLPVRDLFRLGGILSPPDYGDRPAESKVERGFFNAYYFNILSWESNPLNTAQGVTIAAQRIYRKLRTEANTQWTRIVEVSPTTMTYIDRNVAKYSDYVYAVACVDASGIESPFY